MNILYDVFITPLIYILEILIYILNPLLSLNPILAIFIISLTVNFFSYPVFARIEKMIKKDNEDYQKLLPKVNSIKRNFSGYEQRMLLATYFRQNNYHPLLAHFKQSLTIFLQVPIFIASYVVVCESFLFQAPLLDQINNSINLFGLPIKILPIFMTIINMLSARVYMKDNSFSNKLYANSLSILFLILLYFSPASIVLYWIFNNSFAFLRNIYFYNKSKMLLVLIFYLTAVIALAFFVTPNLDTLYVIGIVVLLALFCKFIKFVLSDTFYTLSFLFFLVIYYTMYGLGYVTSGAIYFISIISFFTFGYLIYKYIVKNTSFMPSVKDCAVCLFLMTSIVGAYLPIKIINSDPAEFYSITNLFNLIKYELSTGIGLFFVYPLLMFCLLKKDRKALYFIYLSFSLIGLVELYIFERPRDVLCLTMKFEIINDFLYSFNENIITSLYVIGAFAFVSILMKYKQIKNVNIILLAFIMCYVVISIKEVKQLQISISKYVENSKRMHYSYNLSKKGKNVVIVFIDMAFSGFIPYILDERKDFIETYSGFTYYPRTLSFSAHTLYSVPSMLGGYEYTPLKMQNNTNQNIVDKHNESISVLPELFRKEGYKVSLFDIPYMNYGDNGKPNIYHKDINYLARDGLITANDEKLSQLLKRNMLFFSMFRLTPRIYKNFIYSKGKYMKNSNTREVIKYGSIVSNHYKLLQNFTEDFEILDDNSNNFVIFHSLLTHSYSYLTKDYTLPEKETDVYTENLYFEEPTNVKWYAVNMSTYILLANWIKKLKENGVYDNTRIIIASDHAYYCNIHNISPIISANNAVLMVKDFSKNNNLAVSGKFMSLADIPYLSVKNVINNPKNPFTGKSIESKDKINGIDIITTLFIKRDPQQYEDNLRTYLYDEKVEYMHVDEKIIKELIKIDDEKGN